jgi:competence protein ComEC
MELQEIIHIGPDRAQQIIDLRRIQLFRSVDDLIRVDGIGPARLADIKAQGRACVR